MSKHCPIPLQILQAFFVHFEGTNTVEQSKPSRSIEIVICNQKCSPFRMMLPKYKMLKDNSFNLLVLSRRQQFRSVRVVSRKCIEINTEFFNVFLHLMRSVHPSNCCYHTHRLQKKSDHQQRHVCFTGFASLREMIKSVNHRQNGEDHHNKVKYVPRYTKESLQTQ